MIKHEKIAAIRVPLEKPFDRFYVLITPHDENEHENIRMFTLHCKGYGVILDMFGCGVENDDDAIETAYYNGPDYIKMWIEERDALEEYYSIPFN